VNTADGDTSRYMVPPTPVNTLDVDPENPWAGNPENPMDGCVTVPLDTRRFDIGMRMFPFEISITLIPPMESWTLPTSLTHPVLGAFVNEYAGTASVPSVPYSGTFTAT
jgi:hypothetical protein